MTAMAEGRSANRFVALAAACIAIAMVGMAYAAVPLYRLFCQVTGFGGTTQRALAPSSAPLAQRISVRFDANVAPGLGWSFKPVLTTLTPRIGEQTLISYTAANNTDHPITGTATFNVTPESAGQYFNKIQCFCFTEQTLQPGQAVDMPVVFFVDPAILKGKQASRISEITLSYTFFEVEKPGQTGNQQASLTPRAASAVVSR